MTHKKRPKTNAEMRLEVVENELKQMKVDRAIDNIKNGMARLDGLMKTIKSDLKHDQQQALNFIQGQFMHQTVQAWVIQSAITRANNELIGILGTKAKEKVDLAGLAMFVAFALAPELAGIGIALKKFGDHEDFAKTVVALAKTLGKSYDAAKFIPGKPSQSMPQALDAANDVLRQVYSKSIEKPHTIAYVYSLVLKEVVSGTAMGLTYEGMRTWWTQSAGYQELTTNFMSEAEKTADVLKDFIVYDMLRAFVKKYGRVDAASGYVAAGMVLLVSGAKRELGDLKKFGESSITISGLNDNQTVAIYKKFGNFKAQGRPAIREWQDFVIHWGAKLPTPQGGWVTVTR